MSLHNKGDGVSDEVEENIQFLPLPSTTQGLEMMVGGDV